MNVDLGTNFHFAASAFPYWCLVAFGSKAIFSIGYDLFILRDVPEESVRLSREIEEAKSFLSKKGLKL